MTARDENAHRPAGSADETPADAVVLVDEHDRPVGVAEKLAAHRHGGRLHRAFSVFIFRADGRVLLQLRSRRKHHFGGLWSNACCSHPAPGEDVLAAGRRRLRQELGIDAPVRSLGTFIYRADDPASGLSECELDHVLVGVADAAPRCNEAEADDWRWVSVAELERELAEGPERFTPWFRIAWSRFGGPLKAAALEFRGASDSGRPCD